MAIMINLDGVRVEVPEPRINDFRKIGYRFPQVEGEIGTPEPVVTPASDAIDINKDGLKGLTSLPLVTTAIAKKIQAERGKADFANIDDLVARIPEVEWVSIEDKLIF